MTEPTMTGTKPRKAATTDDELLPDGSMILFDAERQELLTLNPTAALVWECCDGEHDLAAIVAEVREVFPGAPAIAADVRAALAQFRERGMLADDSAA